MKKRGFTLIELLAVLVILVIIMAIATPIILGIIDEARVNAAKSSANGYIDAVEKQIALDMLDGVATPDTFTSLTVPVSGDQPTSVYLTIDENTGVITTGTIHVSGYSIQIDGGSAKAHADIPTTP